MGEVIERRPGRDRTGGRQAAPTATSGRARWPCWSRPAWCCSRRWSPGSCCPTDGVPGPEGRHAGLRGLLPRLPPRRDGQGRIGSVQDPITRYLPELARRDPRFGRITLRRLLTMSSGLADLDPYYDLDLRAVALHQTRIAEPPGQRFHDNNVNPVLLGMALERATGQTVSAYLSARLWGPLGRRPDQGRHPDRPLTPVPVRLVDPARHRPPQ